MKFIGKSTKSYNRWINIEEEFNDKHNSVYNYDNTYYDSFKKPINVMCLEHGEFQTTPKRHLEGQGCPVCVNIKVNGHISVSKKNYELYPNLVIDYLKSKYPNFDFSNFKIDDKFHFKCKKHGSISSSKIKCEKCKKEYNENSKLNNTKKLLTNRTEEIISVKYNNVILKCEHGEHKYNNKQLYANVQLCNKCANTDFNKISQDEFINRAIKRNGDIYNIKNTIYKNAKTKIPLYCDNHGSFYMLTSNFLKGQGCPKCSHITSKAEQEIVDLLPNCEQSNRTILQGKELDIVCNNFAIEYNGLMFHSEGNNKSTKFNKRNLKYKHLEKTELTENKGYQLFHIFENEWINKKQIWMSILNNKIGNNNKIFARKCSIKQLNNLDYKNFCNDNHLQGYGIAKIKLGLYYNDELVSVMSFSKSRFNKNVEYELIRFCTKLNTTVIGGASKLLNNFVLKYNPESIISYANRRWSQGHLYEKLGFEFIQNTTPNYFYFKPNENILFSRNMFQKHKLKDKLNKFDIKLTESENMFNNNYRRIYDSGNKVYIKKYK